MSSPTVLIHSHCFKCLCWLWPDCIEFLTLSFMPWIRLRATWCLANSVKCFAWLPRCADCKVKLICSSITMFQHWRCCNIFQPMYGTAHTLWMPMRYYLFRVVLSVYRTCLQSVRESLTRQARSSFWLQLSGICRQNAGHRLCWIFMVMVNGIVHVSADTLWVASWIRNSSSSVVVACWPF